MKMPEVRSYIRLVLGFYILCALFFVIQSVVIRFGLTRNILPVYFGEKREMAAYIRQEILREAKRDSNFNLEKFIKKQNSGFSRLKLGFIPKSQIPVTKNPPYPFWFVDKTSPHGNQLHGSPPPDSPRRGLLDAVSFNLKTPGHHYEGYLILYSNRFQRANAGINFLFNFMLCTLIPTLILGFFVFRNAYRKSSLLVEAVEKVSLGDYTTRVSLTGNDEYGQIAQAFNKMASSIEEHTRRLQEIDQQRRQFIADISHELSTPLTSIKGYVETLRMEDFELNPEEERQYLGIVWDETERLSLLVKDLLEQARMDAGTVTLEPTGIDCEEFLKAFSNRNSLILKKKGVILEWKAGAGQLIYADYRRLEQIMQNLLDNALRYSKGITRLSIELAENNEVTQIFIYDDGTGIAPEHLDRIFERFYRAPLTPGSQPEINGSASGLGLSIVKGLVELHGGKIIVANVDTRTVFTLEFPKK